MRVAVYPGSFDPITNGHLDIIERASRMFDELLVAIARNSSKEGLFSFDERADLIQKVTAGISNVRVTSFEGLLVDFVRETSAQFIVRGLRAVSDFDYEYAMYQMNYEMSGGADTIFLLASRNYSYLSSTIIKEFARHGRDVAEYTPAQVNAALLNKFGHKK